MEFSLTGINHFLNLFQLPKILKIGFLVFDLFFMIFLIIVIKQVFSMNTLVRDENDAGILKTFSILLIIAAFSLFLVSLAIL